MPRDTRLRPLRVLSSLSNNGKIAAQTDAISGEQIVYTYDALNRLATAVTSDNPSVTQWGQSYTYDGFGNLLDVEHGNEAYPDKAAADKFAAGYLQMVRFSLHRAAKARRISSKILAGMFTKRQIQQAARDRKASVKKSKAEQAEFLNSLDPATRRAIVQAGKEIRAQRKAEGKK